MVPGARRGHAEAVVVGACREIAEDRRVGDGDVEEAGARRPRRPRSPRWPAGLHDLGGQLPRVGLEPLGERQHPVGLEVGPVAPSQQRVGGGGLRQGCREGVRDALVGAWRRGRGPRPWNVTVPSVIGWGSVAASIPCRVRVRCPRCGVGAMGPSSLDAERREKEVPDVAQTTEADWVSRFADEVIAEAERRAPGQTDRLSRPVFSPPGPIHLGNLREVMTPHLVADEIRRRGCECEHIISWDDYDRFRKVPGRGRGRRRVLGRAHRQAADRRARAARQRRTRTGPSTSRPPMADVAGRARGASTAASARPRSTPRAPTASRSCWRCASARRIDAVLGRYRTDKDGRRQGRQKTEAAEAR